MQKAVLGCLFSVVVLAACGTGSTSSSSSSSGGTSSSSSSSGAATCNDVMDGTWHMGTTAATDCFGMAFSMHSAFNAGTCTITYTQPSMTMDHPASATVNGAQVLFHGGTGNSWEGCTATLTDNMTMVTGACSGAQPCTFGMHM